jgi:3-oxoacyl-[acyl-carrier-protein] synthase II
MGCVSPVGNTISSAWQALLSGQSGIATVTKFDASAFATTFAGEVKGFQVEDYIPAKEARHMDTFIHFGMAAGIQAMQDSGLEVTEANAERIGVMVGSGIGGLPMIEETHGEYEKRGPRRISPFFVPASIINMISGHLSIKYGLKGPNLAIVTACTTGLHCIGEAGRLIEYGDADIMIAGGAESTVSPLGIGGFAAARALSSRNDDPATASRPWDKDRDGFVLGEGAGVMVLEEYEHAKARGAKIYAELLGFGMSADAHHMTAPLEDGDGARRCMVAAMRNAGINPDQVDYVNAHGTSTPLGDVAETVAIKSRDLQELLTTAKARGFNQLLIESGPTFGTALLKADLIDEVVLYQAPTFFGSGTPSISDLGVATISERLDFEIADVEVIGADLKITLIKSVNLEEGGR